MPYAVPYLIAAGVAASAAGTAYQISQGSPKQPSPVQASKDPNVDAFRKSNASSFAPGAAAAAGGALTQSAPSQNVGTNTLLGS